MNISNKLKRVRLARMSSDRSWMYERTDENGRVRRSFEIILRVFIAFAKRHATQGGLIKCPCTLENCRNKQYITPTAVLEHLLRYGFMPDYHVWIHHGEEAPSMAYLQWRERRGLGPPLNVITACRNMCMMYWDDDANLMECRYCGLRRYN